MPATLDLTTHPDAILEAALGRAYRQHREAMDARDADAVAECHGATMAVLDEMSRRLDVWIGERG